ncbi:hypothetical protein AeMF1_003610 [Aphanomyces euteiches]|nr:hypothetical protein AeMF1_003610 [Aphanomyces euteiches]KAH9182815.1 hypothetical protein AeNC1_015211 [Aphanomyces euteiches]
MSPSNDFHPQYPYIDYNSVPLDHLESFLLTDGKLHLFNYIGCPYGHRAIWTAIEVNAPFQVVEVSLANKPPSYTEKFNRYGTVPFVLDNGFAVYESAIVAQYLDLKFGDGHLHRVKDPQAASIAQLAAAKFDTQPFFAFMATGDEAAETKMKASLDELEMIYRDDAKAYRDQGPYLLGAQLSSAEINIVPFFHRLNLALVHFRKYDLLANHPLLEAAFDAVQARPSYQRSIASDDVYIQIMTNYVRKE